MAVAAWLEEVLLEETGGPDDNSVLSRLAPETTDLADYIGGAWINDIQ